MHQNVPFSGIKFQNFLGRGTAPTQTPPTLITPHNTPSTPSASRPRCLRHLGSRCLRHFDLPPFQNPKYANGSRRRVVNLNQIQPTSLVLNRCLRIIRCFPSPGKTAVLGSQAHISSVDLKSKQRYPQIICQLQMGVLM